MDPKIKALLEAIAEWQIACDRLSRAVPDPKTAERNAQIAQQNVLAKLQDESVQCILDHFLQQANPEKALTLSAQDTLRQTLVAERSTIVDVEAKSVHPLQLSDQTLEYLIAIYLRSGTPGAVVTTTAELEALLKQLHAAIVAETTASRQLPKKSKRQRKRRLATGITFTAIGLGLLAGNTQSQQSTAPYSYILGGNALLQAIRDLIGESSD